MLLRKLLFWVVWILAAPFVFGRFLLSSPRTAWVLTSLVRLSVYQKLAERKPEITRKLLAEQQVKNYMKANPYTTRKKH